MVFEYCPNNFSFRLLAIFVYITSDTLKLTRTHKKISSSLGLKISHVSFKVVNIYIAVTYSQTNKYNVFR